MMDLAFPSRFMDSLSHSAKASAVDDAERWQHVLVQVLDVFNRASNRLQGIGEVLRVVKEYGG